RITPSVAEQEGQQTETEATGAPQKHHYTLNQQVGSITQKLNGFDERYFMYLEDVDLCRRALQLTKIYYCPETTIVHVFNKGSYKSKLLLWYHIRSAITYFNKWGWFFDKKRYAYNESALRNIPRKLS
ncbi:glycosyltransferase family 2 protein, partial [Klebsiella pneumoniae]